jgi:hypothetical protein
MGPPLVIHNVTNPGNAQVTLWTPNSAYFNSRFLLKKLIISVNGTLAGATFLTLLDGAVNMGVPLSIVPGAALATQIIQLDFPDDGYLSVQDGNALAVYLSVALTTGSIVFTSEGYEV